MAARSLRSARMARYSGGTAHLTPAQDQHFIPPFVEQCRALSRDVARAADEKDLHASHYVRNTTFIAIWRATAGAMGDDLFLSQPIAQDRRGSGPWRFRVRRR